MLLLTSSQQTCMTYTITVCTVKTFWWWTEELSETRRVLFQNKSEKLVHIVGFIIRNKPYELVQTYTHIYSMPVYMKHPPGLLEGAGSECRKYKKHEICSLLGFYTALGGRSVTTLRDNLSVPSSRVKDCLTPKKGRRYDTTILSYIMIQSSADLVWVIVLLRVINCKWSWVTRSRYYVKQEITGWAKGLSLDKSWERQLLLVFTCNSVINMCENAM
jgi:hypothetical protein